MPGEPRNLEFSTDVDFVVEDVSRWYDDSQAELGIWVVLRVALCMVKFFQLLLVLCGLMRHYLPF